MGGPVPPRPPQFRPPWPLKNIAKKINISLIVMQSSRRKKSQANSSDIHSFAQLVSMMVKEVLPMMVDLFQSHPQPPPEPFKFPNFKSSNIF